ELLGEGVVGVVQAPPKLGEGRQVQVFAEQGVCRRIDGQSDRLLIRKPGRREPEHRSHGSSHRSHVAVPVSEQSGDSSVQLPVELEAKLAGLRARLVKCGEQPELRRLLQGEGLLHHHRQ
ncbi:hypothetical protein RZS08_46700, partial [Arthrospira platensis SPKY1]|nr:hypothetical protein [Arthrospira platensis SPKY1]